MTPDMMVIIDYDGRKVAGDRDPSSEMPMHLEVYRKRPDVERGRPRASADRDRLCRGRHPARSRGAGRGGDDARQHSDCRVRRRRRRSELPEAVRKYIKAHDGMLLANHGALTCGHDRVLGVLQDGDDRALREDQPRGAAARAAKTCSRARKSSGCRDCAGCTASRRRRRSAPIRRSRPMRQVACQVLEAPPSPDGRLVPDGSFATTSRDGEIRLTYRELTALIEDAVKTLKFGLRIDELRFTNSMDCRSIGSKCVNSASEDPTWVRRSEWSRPRVWSR